MNYDNVSVHDLIFDILNQGYLGNYDPIPEIESALRKAVVREASVGTYIHACDFPAEDVVYMENNEPLPIGDYWLIPKETP